MHEVFRS